MLILYGEPAPYNPRQEMGSSALLMEWGIVRGRDINLYGEKVKAYLIAGARRLPQISYPNINQGYGMLCLEAALARAIL